MIALTIQVMIEPARRAYDDGDARAAGRPVRAARALGGDDRAAWSGRSSTCVVPAFTGSTTVAVPIACNYDLEVAAAKYLHSLPDGEAPLALHFNGIVYYPDDEGGLQMVLIPWSRSVGFRMPVSVWKRDDRALLPQHRLGGPALADPRGARAAARRRARMPRSTPRVADLLGESARWLTLSSR